MAYAFFLLPLHIGLLRGANKAEAIVGAAVVRGVDAPPVGNLRVEIAAATRTTALTAVKARRRA